MTVAVKPRARTYIEDGVSVAFAVPWKFNAPEDVHALRTSAAGVQTELVYGSDYSVTGGETDDGGELTVTAAAVAGTRLSVWSDTARGQTDDYETNDTFPAETHEDELDRLSMVDQEQDAELGRRPKYPRGAPTIDFASLANMADGDILEYRAGLLQRKDPAPFAGKVYGGDAAGRMTPLVVTDPNGLDTLASLVLGTGARLIGWLRDATGTLRTLWDKLTELDVSPEDFGAIGDANPEDGTGTDDSLALEKARDFLLANGGGRIRLTKYYGASRDFVIEDSKISLVGTGSRCSGIVGLASGAFAEAVVKLGGKVSANGLIFSVNLKHTGIIAPGATAPCLLAIAPQENVKVDDMVLSGSYNCHVLRIVSGGSYFATGNVGQYNCHRGQFTNLHIITGAGSTGPGVFIEGAIDCTLADWTTTTPVAGGAPSVLGSIGVEIGGQVSLIEFGRHHIEGFTQPVRITGPFPTCNVIGPLTATAIPALPAGSTIITIDAAAESLPIDFKQIGNVLGQYTNFVKFEDTGLTVAHTDVPGGVLGHLRVRVKLGADGNYRYVTDSDVDMVEGRPVNHLNRVIHKLYQFADGDTAPSVKFGNHFYTANTAPTAINNFADGVNGQIIHVEIADANTTIVTGGGIVTHNGVTLEGSGNIFTFQCAGGGSYWLQRSNTQAQASIASPTADVASLKVAVDSIRSALIAAGVTLS